MARAKKENISKTEVKANTLEKDIKSTLNKKEARLNRLELQRKLKQKKQEIDIEIKNISTWDVDYIDPREKQQIFSLSKVGSKDSTEFIDLDTLYRIVRRSPGFFEEHRLIISDVDSLDVECTPMDIIDFLGLNSLYEYIRNPNEDYLEYFLSDKVDINSFEKILNKNNVELTRRLAERAIDLHKKKKFDSGLKAKLLAKRIGMEDLYLFS
ncbi:TPA: hypothetical protein P1M42_000025 [Clostridioides difficile]|uniref:Uncharacterized protein n=1 Tax=Clostridioides difficile ATCC 9689 = DSM 1296 TaxID=1121308 RepID=A0ACA7UP96_CLODI|nr:hypothetical protein [Clostridioides difficile]YP_009221603.1 Putative AcrB/AcrD/AcrF family protein, multidrug resistance [Clostridium phage phiCD211]AKP44682.1 hypothetical protein CDIF1296T_phi008 [Peptoclostridium phage phiCDIF1296T]CCL66961.1 hypothetical protein BN183_3680018 [Clostridioides difficile E7]ARC17047.1 hypothetical protein A6J95_20050 [Clostridioides difficile]AVI14365.1 hypothetical protein C4J70_19245 [Clostridioides difficile]EQF50140.1 hypothetical protein QG5_3934 [